MAKKSSIEKNEHRRALVQRYAARRAALKKIVDNRDGGVCKEIPLPSLSLDHPERKRLGNCEQRVLRQQRVLRRFPTYNAVDQCVEPVHLSL